MECIPKRKVPLMAFAGSVCDLTFEPLLLLTSYFWLELLSNASPKITCF